jgi:hypothetical protein
MYAIFYTCIWTHILLERRREGEEEEDKREKI